MISRSFRAFLRKQAQRTDLEGRVARELLATKRAFTSESALTWMLCDCTDDPFGEKYDACARLVAEYNTGNVVTPPEAAA
jgi:hypothetical protein